MEENYPTLVSCKPVKSDYECFKKINITCTDFSLGRGLQNSITIPFLAISRNHCLFRRSINNEWILEDTSSLGISINGQKLGKGKTKLLSHEDIIVLEPSQEFVYKFIHPYGEDFEIPKKRMKLNSDNDMSDVKMKFEESQNFEIKHIEEKIQNAKQMQITTNILKKQLQLEMTRKIQQLESEFAMQIENLKGEKNEVEQQKALLLEERDTQLAKVKEERESKIKELMDQIQKHNETESELIKENNHLKEKLDKEREEFLAEISRENSSKQEMMEKLQARIKEQEDIRLKEKQELEEALKKETEQLQLAKEKELKELEEQKQLRELEFTETLNSMKQNLEEQVKQKEQQRLLSEQQLNDQMEQMKKLSDEDKCKMGQLMKEREDIQQKLAEAQTCAEKSIEQLRLQVQQREVELAALAAERIQKQADQSNEVINSLQQQLERVKTQLKSVETEKNSILEGICAEVAGESTSKKDDMEEVGELMETEFQCSICAELFIVATTLNCSHTFCKYCIQLWKKKKKDCPICRAPITSECKSLVVDSFIDRIIQSRSEEIKKRRSDLLKNRQAEVEASSNRTTTATRTSTSRRRGGRRATTTTIPTSTSTGTGGVGTAPIAPTPRIPTVDLTGIPSPRTTTTMMRSVRLPARQAQVPVTLVRPTGPPVTYQIVQQNGQVVAMIVDEGVEMTPIARGTRTSQVSQTPTTAAMGTASLVALAGTGRPAAPSDNLPPLP